MGILKKYLTVMAVSSLLLLSGCGGDDDSNTSADADAPDAGDPADQGDQSVDEPDGAGGDSDVVVTVGGVEYPMTIVQTCHTERDEDRSTDLAMYGFAESGERVELSFRYQTAEDSPTGTDQYYGQVGVKSGEVSAQVSSDEPFDFLEGDRSTVTGAVTMESTSGESVTAIEVAFTITCP